MRGEFRITFCILASGRLFELLYGVEKFTLDLGNWLVNHNHDVILIGSGFASVKTKRLSKLKKDESKKELEKEVRALNPPYVIYMLYTFLYMY